MVQLVGTSLYFSQANESGQSYEIIRCIITRFKQNCRIFDGTQIKGNICVLH